MPKKQKIIVILGQTATGKSDLAIKIAKKINGEIISADSRQVYKGLNIGTGKIPRDKKSTHKSIKSIPGMDSPNSPNRVWTYRGIFHYLLDVASPKRKFTVVRYQKLAISAIAEIIKKSKTPIICGGTGFYIDAIVKNIIFPKVPPNEKLRKKLSLLSTTALFHTLQKIDARRAKDIKKKNEQNNKVRLTRAIEIASALGKVPRITKTVSQYKFVKIGLYLPDNKLRKKIKKRLLKRINETTGDNMIKEARKLHRQHISWKRMRELGLEYKYLAFYLQKKITKQQMIQKLETEIYQYAKRQMTWFKRDKEIRWFDASKKYSISVLLEY